MRSRFTNLCVPRQALHRLLVKLTNRRRVSLEGRGNCLNGYQRLSPALSDPSIPPESDSEDSEDSEDGHRKHTQAGVAARPVEEEVLLRKLMDKYRHEMERSRSKPPPLLFSFLSFPLFFFCPSFSPTSCLLLLRVCRVWQTPPGVR